MRNIISWFFFIFVIIGIAWTSSDIGKEKHALQKLRLQQLVEELRLQQAIEESQ